MPKLRGLFSNRGFTTFFTSTFLTARGAAATFFPAFFLGYKYQMRLSSFETIQIHSIFHVELTSEMQFGGSKVCPQTPFR